MFFFIGKCPMERKMSLETSGREGNLCKELLFSICGQFIFGRVLRSAALFGDHMGEFSQPTRGVLGQLVCGRKSDVSLMALIWRVWTWFTLVGGLEHFLFFHILGIITPTDYIIFFRGVGSTTSQVFLLACVAIPILRSHNLTHTAVLWGRSRDSWTERQRDARTDNDRQRD